MLKKISLILNTVRFLKNRQIFYQLYYRLRPGKNLNKFARNSNQALSFNFLNFKHSISVNEIVTAGNCFDFLSEKKNFGASINWDYQQFGKLWNYNLQYFNYLHQDNLPDEIKLSYLTDIGRWLNDGRLKLEPYPVSLRVMNVIRYLSGKKEENTGIVIDTYCQVNYLFDNIEYHLLGNHLLENAFALMMGAVFFGMEKWARVAKKILYIELDEQVLEDGGHFELSPMYHQIILFRVLELIDWYRNYEDHDTAFLSFMEQKAVKMISWLNNISFNNGDIPHFNDSTDGIAYSTRQLQLLAKQLNLDGDQACSLGDSGYRKFATEKYECVVDAGQIGPGYQPGHSHADALSFVLHVNEIPVIIDTGTSTYQIGEQRSLERSTRAHNTVVIAHKNQSEVWGGFRVGRRAKTTITNETETDLTASHDGYKKDFGAIHQRSFSFGPGSVTIKDKIIGNSGILSQSFLHFHPERVIAVTKDNLIIIDNIAEIKFIGSGRPQINKYQSALGFNKYSEATFITVDFYESLEMAIKVL